MDFVFGVLFGGKGVNDFLGDIECFVSDGHQLIELGGFEDIELATPDLVSCGSDFGLEGNFVGEDGHSAKDEHSNEQHVQAHGGFEQGEADLAFMDWSLSHRFGFWRFIEMALGVRSENR